MSAPAAPAAPGAPGAVIVLHGHDDDPAAFVGPATAIAPPGWQVVVPTGPVEIGAGRAWFSSDEQGAADGGQVETSLALIDALIDGLVATGVDPPRISLVGYSQGAALALLWALRTRPRAMGPDRSIGALAVVAGWLPTIDGIDVDPAACRAARVFVGHGADDQVVPLPAGRSVARLLERHATPVTFVELEVDHTLAPFLDELEAWLAITS